MTTDHVAENVTYVVTMMKMKRRKKMVAVKKNTINREAFEREMDEIKNLVRQGTDPDVVILAINNAKSRLTEFIDEKDAELFRIPEWINQDVTVSIQAKEIG